MKDIVIGFSLLWLIPWSIWATEYILEDIKNKKKSQIKEIQDKETPHIP